VLDWIIMRQIERINCICCQPISLFSLLKQIDFLFYLALFIGFSLMGVRVAF